MRKIIISTIAVASLLATAAAANAQFIPYVCYWYLIWNGFSWVPVCN
jgi:hypothetical protein